MIYNPLFKILRSPKREKKHPLLNEISGWKVKYTPLFYTSRAGLRRAKIPLYRRFWEHACGPSDPGVGGPGLYSQCSNPNWALITHIKNLPCYHCTLSPQCGAIDTARCTHHRLSSSFSPYRRDKNPWEHTGMSRCEARGRRAGHR